MHPHPAGPPTGYERRLVRLALANRAAEVEVDRLDLHYVEDSDHPAVRRAIRTGAAVKLCERESGLAVTVTDEATLPSLPRVDALLAAEDRRVIARHRRSVRRTLDRHRRELDLHRRHGPVDCWARHLAREVGAYERYLRIPPVGMVAQRAPRPRGAGRPARRATRSSAKSGDSGDGPAEPEPAQQQLAEVEFSGRLSGIAQRLRANGGQG